MYIALIEWTKLARPTDHPRRRRRVVVIDSIIPSPLVTFAVDM